ncbi:hypothetical protein PENTCL1PPCAC_30064 [Pristionchus entomophagus]|uniref:GATOR2 complex protein MIO zinc-ribbon like domain-containing protein n=1 Tax=Pristionchus entomophagus TaxID=358040 RepID=A0AAV5UPL7_9BILA|nr:hypothetical protein PENTCL1PPCAC_30064 [Pristionchus entomophagus]
MAYLSSSASDSGTSDSSGVSFLANSSDDDAPDILLNRSNKYPKKKLLRPEQQSQLLVKKDPLGLFPDRKKSTLVFKRERKLKRHYELDREPNRGSVVSIHGNDPVNPYFEEKWARTVRELKIPVIGDKRSGFAIKKRGKELKWRPDHELLTPPSEEPTSHCIYEDGYKNPDVPIPLRIEQDADSSRRNTFVPLIQPRVHALEGGIVHVFDSRSLRTYRIFDKQEFDLIASLRFDEMLPEEQLTCTSFVSTRHSIALGFADGNAAICRVEIDHSTQQGRGRHNFEYVMAPAEANLVMTKIEQHPCTPRFVALCYYDAPKMSYVVRVIDQDRLLDSEKTIRPAGDKEKDFFSQYPDDEKDTFGARQGPFRTVDGKEPIPMKEPKQHARVLSVRTMERVTDLMWFSDRRNLLMIFTERAMRLADISKEDKDKVLKSCSLARPLTRPTVHPGRPSLFSALDRHRVVLYDRRCLKSPISIVDVPSKALGRGMPSFAAWCTSDMDKLFVHYRTSQRAAVIEFNHYPDCAQLTDGGCEENLISPVLNQLPTRTQDLGKDEFRWPYNFKDEFPVSKRDHFIAEDDLEGGLMEATPFPQQWKEAEGPLMWRPEFEVTTLPFTGTSKSIRRVQSDLDITTINEEGNFVHPFKRYMRVARDRRDESVFNECVEWRVWNQIHSLTKRRAKSEERPQQPSHRRYRYSEEEYLIRPIPVTKMTAYAPHLQKNEIVYPVYTSEFVDVPAIETILKMSRPRPKKVEFFKGRPPPKVPVKRESIDYEDVDAAPPPGPIMLMVKRESRCDVPLNHTRIPICHGGMYYGIQGRPLRQMRATIDHAKFFDTHDGTREMDMTRSKKKRLVKERRRDEIMRLLMDEEEDLMSANDCRWIKLHSSARGGCDPTEPKYDPFVQRLRKTRIHDSDDSDDASSIDPHDDCFRRSNGIREISKNDFPFVEDRSLFGVNKIQKRPATSAWNTHLIELPVNDPQSFCLFAFSMEMIVQGRPRDAEHAPNSVIMKIVLEEHEPQVRQQRLCFPQVADMSAYLRSVLGMNSLQSVKLVKLSGFGEFVGADIPKGYIDTLKHLRQHLEDSDGNRFALDYIERLFNDNHIADHDRGFPKRFEVENPVYSDTTDEDDPKKKKKKIVFASHDDRPKMEQLKEKLYKKKRAKFLKRRRACEELKLDYDSLFPPNEVNKQKSLTELFDKGDPKRSILNDPIPTALYDHYSGSSDSNEEAHYLPPVSVRQPAKKDYDFDEEEQIIARETKEIEIIQQFRKEGKIPPFEFKYDDDGNMICPKPATLEQEYNFNIQTTRTLLRRMVERDTRVNELKRRKEILLDRLPEEIAEDTYDRMMSDLKVLFDELEDDECNLAMTGNFFRNRKQRMRRKVYGQGWRRNRKLQHKFLNQSLDLCDHIYAIRRRIHENEDNEKRRRKLLRKSQREAKLLLREICRRDVSGDYLRVIREVQFRRHSYLRDFDLYDFLEAFEDVTLKMCGRRFSSHHELVRSMTHLRKDRFERTDPRYNNDVRPCFTDESDSDFRKLQVSSVSSDSSSSLSEQPLIVSERTKKLVKRRRRETSTFASESDDGDVEGELIVASSEGEPVVECEILDNHPPVLLPTSDKLFYEAEAAALPISRLVYNPVDPLKQLASYSKKDLKPPPRLKLGRKKRIKNRKQRNKRDRKIWMDEQAVLKEKSREREKKSMDQIIELMGSLCISTPVDREKEWRRRRDARMTEGMRYSYSTPGKSTPHRSITRKFLDKLGLGGSRPMRVFANGSIYPPLKTPYAKIVEKFDPYTNPFARKPVADPDQPRPRPTFYDDSQSIEIAVDTTTEKSIFPPDEFGHPLRIGEKIPNNVEWVFPRYWAMREARREKQKRKRRRRFQAGKAKVTQDTWKFIPRAGMDRPARCEDTLSTSTCSTRVNSSFIEIPELTSDEIIMAKYICISNPGIPRAVSALELSTRNEQTDLLLRPRSCIGRITDDMQALDAIEAEFAGSQELPPPPGLIMDEQGRYLWHSKSRSSGENGNEASNLYEDFSDTRPMTFLLSPPSDDDDHGDYDDDDVTPVPPRDDDKTPTEASMAALLHTNTPEADELVEKKDTNHLETKVRAESPKKKVQAKSTAAGDRVLANKPTRKTQAVEPRDAETEKRGTERSDFLMDKRFFEELGVVPEQMRGGLSPEHVDLPAAFPAAWLTLNKPKKFKRIIRSDYVHPLPTIPEVEIEKDTKSNRKSLKDLFFGWKSSDVPIRVVPMMMEPRIRVRPGTPIVDINAIDSEVSQDDYETEEEHCLYGEEDATDIEDYLEDEQYKDDQEDQEIMECFKSESEEDAIGEDMVIDSAQEQREESIELDAIDAATTVSEAPTLTKDEVKNMAVEILLEGASEADDLSSDEAANEEVMNVFGRNLVPPVRSEVSVVDPYSLPPPPIEEKPLSVEMSDEDVDDEITVAEEAFDSLLDARPIPVPIVVPPEIIRPERLLDLMPSNLIFEGVDYWGLTEAQMEQALDEVITARERIREELLKPPPKQRHVYQLVHEENDEGEMREVVALEFSSSDSECYEGDSWSKSISREKGRGDIFAAVGNVVYTSGQMEAAPPTPPPQSKEYHVPCRDRKRMQNKIRWWRDKLIDKVVEDRAWETLLEYIKCEFHHNSYGRKPVVFVPHLNLIRGLPRHILKAYIDQMRVRRWEENDLMEQLEEQNHLFRLKGRGEVQATETSGKGRRSRERLTPRGCTIKFAYPVSVIPARIYQPTRSTPKRRSILKIRPPTPEPPVPVVEHVTPAVEIPVKQTPTTKFHFKKTVKKIESPHPDDTKFPTEQGYSLENAQKFRFEATKHLLRPGTEKYQSRFIYKCRGVPGIVQISMNELTVKKDFIKDTALLGGFYFMRSKERIAVLRAVGLCDYKSDQIAELLESRRMSHENPFALALMALVMGQGTYTINFLSRVHRDGWYDHRTEDRRVRNEADAIVRYCMLFCEWRAESLRLPETERNVLRRSLLDKYLVYKQLEDACIFTRCIMAFLLTLAYSETRHFVDDVVLCKQVPMIFRVAFATLFCETTAGWQQTLIELLKELSPHDIQRFAFTGIGRHPDSINAILEFAKHTSDVQFASFLLIVGECFDVQPFVKTPRHYEKRGNRLLNPRREIYKYWFALNNEMESSTDRDRRVKVYSELVKTQSALLGYTLKHDLYQAMKEKARPPMEQIFPVAFLYPQTDMKILEQQAYEVMRHYAYVLQLTHNWIAAAQIFYVMRQSETVGIKNRFETEVEIACSFCSTTLSYGRKKARQIKKEEKKKLEDARERHMEAQRKRMEQGLAPQPFTGGPKKGPAKDIPDDVDTKIRAIACLACRKPLPRCAICFNHMFNPVANEEGLRGEQVGFGFAACRRCHHGGHPDHLDIWFRENYRCPVSQCNCECDYDNYWDTLTLHESLDYKLLGAPQLTLGVHQGAHPVSPPPRNSDDDDEEGNEEGDEDEDEEERELEDARKRFCYGRISVD